MSNLHGKAIERINIERDSNGDIVTATFDKSASLGLGSNMNVTEGATYFSGPNAFGNLLIGGVSGDYNEAELGNLTPNNKCKENGCTTDLNANGGEGGRMLNRPVCPIPSSRGDLLYITLSGGGLFVGKTDTTPMRIVAEYGKNVIYGSGCGGVEVRNNMYIDSGISAPANPGGSQSLFAIWSFQNSQYLGRPTKENKPRPLIVFQDPGNGQNNTSGQRPGNSTRRDSHGMIATLNGKYIHTFDRIQAQAYVFDSRTNKGSFAYSLRTDNVCEAFSVEGYPFSENNDPAPDIADVTPDEEYIVVAFRGPVPVTFAHSTQGSCPGVGIVKLGMDGRMGSLVTVLRTTNELVVTTPPPTPAGVIQSYSGLERSDIHMVAVINRDLW